MDGKENVSGEGGYTPLREKRIFVNAGRKGPLGKAFYYGSDKEPETYRGQCGKMINRP